jgi:cation transport ATPase
MSTEKKEKTENGIVENAVKGDVDTSFENIDDACSMVNTAKQNRADEEAKRKQKDEENKKRAKETAMAAKKEADKKAKQEEETRKTNETKYIRKKMKRNATAMTFALCLSSAVVGYVITGILVNMIFNPSLWLFIGIMGVIGSIDTLAHTYMYRYIREEIYRK